MFYCSNCKHIAGSLLTLKEQNTTHVPMVDSIFCIAGSLLTLEERWAEGNGGEDPAERATEMAKVVRAPAEALPHVVPVKEKAREGGRKGIFMY